jgi:hypothetical protein
MILDSFSYATSLLNSAVSSVYSLPMPTEGVLVAYCSATKRTTVSSTRRIVTDWRSYPEQLEWLSRGKPVSIDLLIIYSDDQPSPPIAIRSSILALAEPKSISIDFAEAGVPLTTVVEVSKIKAATTLIRIPSHLGLDPSRASEFGADTRGPIWCSLTNVRWMVMVEIEHTPVPIWKRYDGERGWTRIPPLSDVGRSLLQEARIDRYMEDGTRKRPAPN